MPTIKFYTIQYYHWHVGHFPIKFFLFNFGTNSVFSTRTLHFPFLPILRYSMALKDFWSTHEMIINWSSPPRCNDASAPNQIIATKRFPTDAQYLPHYYRAHYYFTIRMVSMLETVFNTIQQIVEYILRIY